jgi:hypothetical protein
MFLRDVPECVPCEPFTALVLYDMHDVSCGREFVLCFQTFEPPTVRDWRSLDGRSRGELIGE